MLSIPILDLTHSSFYPLADIGQASFSPNQSLKTIRINVDLGNLNPVPTDKFLASFKALKSINTNIFVHLQCQLTFYDEVEAKDVEKLLIEFKEKINKITEQADEAKLKIVLILSVEVKVS